MALRHRILDDHDLGNDRILVSYIPSLDDIIIKSHNLDIIKIKNRYKDDEVQSLNIASVPISAAVTAYGRIHITNIKLKIAALGGNI
jgi:hypothetical protein